jgi:hypothetical protein
LAIPRAHFDELVAAGRVKVHATGEFKWGTFALYRRGDVQDLLPEVPALTAARKAAQAARRQQASKKAVVTRQRTVAEVATARTSTQHQLAKKTRGRSLYEQALALVGFWGELVSAHADTYTGMANRARNPETSTRYRHIANDCYATKNELSALLARIHDPRVVWDFYDAGRLWLCDACREDAREMGMHPIEYVDYGSCNNCTIDHYYSVLGATITIDEPREITIPVPVALAWEGSSADAQPRARKFGARPHEALPSWIRKIKSARNYSRYDLPVPRVTPAQLKAYPADVALEALSAAISSLRESLPGAILTA